MASVLVGHTRATNASFRIICERDVDVTRFSRRTKGGRAKEKVGGREIDERAEDRGP